MTEPTITDDEYYNTAMELVMAHMKWSRVNAVMWMEIVNPLLGGASPKDLILMGRGEKLIKFIKQCIEENGRE